MRAPHRALLAALLIAASLFAPAPAKAQDSNSELPAIVAEVMPSVVTVLASGIVQLRAGAAVTEPTAAGAAPARAPATTERTRSIGSGFIIDPKGLVVTNNHVIDGADAIAVTLQDGSFLLAHLVGQDVPTDLALLKVDTTHPLPAVALGDSSSVELGESVFAIGNPFGIGSSVTSGIVSALGRDIQEGPYDSFIQTDAPINRGNSGGPLFDMAGSVIGINSAIYTPSGGSVGISFAIPSNIARTVVEELDKHGYVPRAWLGAGVQQLTEPFAESLGLDGGTQGAIVAGVVPDSPAAAAGLRNGDVILRYNDRVVHDAPQLSRSVALAKPGSVQQLTIWRHGQQITLPVKVAAQPRQGPAPRVVSMRMAPMHAYADLGLKLAPLSPEALKARGLAPGGGGVLVASVAPDSFAAEDGVHAGDAILNVEQGVVSTPEQVWKQVEAARQAKRFWLLMLLQGPAGLRWVNLPAVIPDSL